MSQARLATFRRAVSSVPGYRQLLAEHGVEPAAIVDRQTFTALCYETVRTLNVRRAALQNSELARELFGDCHATPRVLEYDERRTVIEAHGLDEQGYGRMTISLIDRALPLFRYQTSYLVRLLDPSRVMLAMWRRGCRLSGPLPSALFALAGREQDEGRNGSDDIPDRTVAQA